MGPVENASPISAPRPYFDITMPKVTYQAPQTKNSKNIMSDRRGITHLWTVTCAPTAD